MRLQMMKTITKKVIYKQNDKVKSEKQLNFYMVLSIQALQEIKFRHALVNSSLKSNKFWHGLVNLSLKSN